MKNTRIFFFGVKVANKMEKTVVVEITRRYRHPLYRKVVTSDMRLKAHDEFKCNIGDEVIIVETRPISKTKRWAVEEITKRNLLAEDVPEA